jgi:hypothetical protein
MDTSVFVPKFGREEVYPIEVLQEYEDSVQAACLDKDLARWARDPSGPTKKFVKLRADEYLPALRFAKLHLPDKHTHFRLPPEGHAVDIQLGSETDLRDFQITVANADWANDGSNPGKHHHLSKKLLNQDGVVYGNGPFEKKDGKVVNLGRMMRAIDEGDHACRRAIAAALERKANTDGANCTLLIYLAESGLALNSPLDQVVAAAAAECTKLPTFEATYVLNHDQVSVSLAESDVTAE